MKSYPKRGHNLWQFLPEGDFAHQYGHPQLNSDRGSSTPSQTW
ncbi:hypothetical protein [Leptolyngbya sp. FACHB-17]|nr:hypothetical protein [Leptolyngbya sp. FACHB-17]